MNRIFKEIAELGFTDAQTGALFRMALEYLESGEVEIRDKSLTAFFYNNIAHKIDKLKKDRERKGQKRYAN